MFKFTSMKEKVGIWEEKLAIYKTFSVKTTYATNYVVAAFSQDTVTRVSIIPYTRDIIATIY